MPASLQFALGFDRELLKSQLALILPGEWTCHYNERDYDGDWRGVALRSLSGLAHDLGAHEAKASDFQDTALLARLPGLRSVLSSFECPLKSVRLLSLLPNSLVREHSDPGFGYSEGRVRIHVPIQTSPRVEFYLEGKRLRLDEGHAYYIDAGRPHRVRNRGAEHRIHMVIDAEINAWLRDAMEKGQPVESIPPAPASFHEFRKHVLSLPDLQQDLHETTTESEFQRRAVYLGRKHGYDFDEGDIVHETSTIEQQPGPAWLPITVRVCDSEAFAEWIYFGNRRLNEPFFADSVRMSLRNPFVRTFRHETVLRQSKVVMPPAGFIFHMSRCGSTLVSRMFGALSRVVSVSEAAPVDDVIQASPRTAGSETQAGWLRSIISALGRQRTGEAGYIVKLDAWHIHSLPLIRSAFPETPWVFLYRDPVEVLVSHQRRPGMFALPGAMNPETLGMQLEDVTRLSRVEWTARALAGFCQSALSHHDDAKGLFFNYGELPEGVWGRLSRHFSLSLSDDEILELRTVAEYNAKSSGIPFQPDSSGKRDEATTAMRHLAAEILNPLYMELERLRAAGAIPVL